MRPTVRGRADKVPGRMYLRYCFFGRDEFLRLRVLRFDFFREAGCCCEFFFDAPRVVFVREELLPELPLRWDVEPPLLERFFLDLVCSDACFRGGRFPWGRFFSGDLLLDCFPPRTQRKSSSF